MSPPGRKVDSDSGGVGKRRPALPVPVKRATVRLLGHGSVGQRTLPGNPRWSSSQWQQRRVRQVNSLSSCSSILKMTAEPYPSVSL